MKPINLAVLGAGRIGSLHAELITHRMDDIRVAGIYDIVPDLARATADRLGIRAVTAAEELIADPAVDAVAVCSSTDSHIEHLTAAAAAGKAVFCEKPLSLSLEEVDRGLAAVEEAGVALQVGFNRRFDPSHRAVAEAVRNGDVGEVQLVRITSRDPAPPSLPYIETSGGIFLDMTIHDFDMARFVTGSEVNEVYAKGAVMTDPAIREAGDLDTAVILLTHDNGALTMIDNSRRALYGYDQRVEAFGSAGMASSGNPTVDTTVVRTAQGGRTSTLPYFFVERYIPSYLAEWRAFAEMMRGGPSPVTGHDGREPLVMGLAAWRSVREGRPVATSEIRDGG